MRLAGAPALPICIRPGDATHRAPERQGPYLASEGFGSRPGYLVGRNVADVLGEVPAVAEGVGDLAVAVAPEHVAERVAHLAAGVGRALPERIDVVGVELQDGGRAAHR